MESQNFDEINTAKLSIGEGEGVVPIVWDYFKDVIIKHLLDDASQVRWSISTRLAPSFNVCMFLFKTVPVLGQQTNSH